MRIAMITTHPPGQGSLNEYAYHFVRFLRQKPEVREIILLTDELPAGKTYDLDANFRLTDDSTQASVPVQVIPCWRFGAWNNAARIVAAVRRNQPDIVFFNLQFATFGDGKISAALGLATPALVKAAGYPTVVLLHNIMEAVDLKSAGFINNRMIETAIRFFGRMATRLLLTTNLVALTIPKYVETLREKYGVNNVFLAPHGSFDEDVTEPNFNLPPGPNKIITFGKFGTYKKVETLIEAFKQLQAEGRRDVELIIAGSDSPNAAGYLAAAQQKYHQMSGLRFTGYVAEKDVPHLFRNAAVVVFPYTSTTGSSGVLHQAGSYAKATVLPHLGDFAELIAEEGYAGEFFEPEDAQSMAQAIARIIDDPVYRCEMGAKNFAASQGIRIEEVVDWYLLHFETLLKQPPINQNADGLQPVNLGPSIELPGGDYGYQPAAIRG